MDHYPGRCPPRTCRPRDRPSDHLDNPQGPPASPATQTHGGGCGQRIDGGLRSELQRSWTERITEPMARPVGATQYDRTVGDERVLPLAPHCDDLLLALPTPCGRSPYLQPHSRCWPTGLASGGSTAWRVAPMPTRTPEIRRAASASSFDLVETQAASGSALGFKSLPWRTPTRLDERV